jgi:hypothetical protein
MADEGDTVTASSAGFMTISPDSICSVFITHIIDYISQACELHVFLAQSNHHKHQLDMGQTVAFRTNGRLFALFERSRLQFVSYPY